MRNRKQKKSGTDQKMTIKKDITPLAICLFSVIISIGFKILNFYELNYKHYIGIALVLISAILYFKNKKIYRYVFGITLFAGAANLTAFFFINFLLNIGFIQINPIVLLLLFLFLSQNKQLTDKIFPNKKPLTKANQINELEKTELQIQNFERKFHNKTESELKAILNENNAYVNEARIAADRVLKKKHTNTS